MLPGFLKTVLHLYIPYRLSCCRIRTAMCVTCSSLYSWKPWSCVGTLLNSHACKAIPNTSWLVHRAVNFTQHVFCKLVPSRQEVRAAEAPVLLLIAIPRYLTIALAPFVSDKNNYCFMLIGHGYTRTAQHLAGAAARACRSC